MKTRLLLFVFAVTAFIAPISAQENTPFNVSCRIVSGTNPLPDYAIVVYSEGEQRDSIRVKKTQSELVRLETNRVYTLRFIKKGYAEKLILVDTHLPNRTDINTIDVFDFDVELLKTADEHSLIIGGLPVALIHYENRRRGFDYSKAYSDSLRKRFIP